MTQDAPQNRPTHSDVTTGPIHGPHAHHTMKLSSLMLQVMLALLPATLFGFWLYGWAAVLVWGFSLLTALFWEALFLRLFEKPVAAGLQDGSALVTGWLLALCLPPFVPWWLLLVANFLAIGIIKQIFGGLGQNLFNPAIAARVMLLIAFPVEMTTWLNPDLAAGSGLAESLKLFFGLAVQPDGLTGATFLGEVKMQTQAGAALSASLAEQNYNLSDVFIGRHSGSLGESTALLLTLGGLFLLWRGVITWQAPVGLLAGVAVPALLLNLAQPDLYPDAGFHLLTGGVMLAAWFIVTDPVTCPATATGRLLFGLGCGLLIWLIRSFGNYPEGVAFAVMLMNSATPVIDRYVKPRIYGRNRKGEPLNLSSGAPESRS